MAQTGELLHSVHEPTEAFNTAGIAIFHNQSGQKTGGFALFQNLEAGRFIKGNGVGDIEIIDEPPTTGIGNRVWHDANADGIQDPDEMPMADVALSLYQADTLVAKTLSDADGHYWFDAQNIKGGLLPETNYQIRVNEKRYDFTTGRVGQNREDLDIGLPCSECTKIVGLDTKTLVESEDTEGLAVFPNPAQKYIQVQMKADVPNETTTLIELIDLTGRPLKQQSGVFRNGQLQATVSIQDLPTGTFFVRLKTNGKANSKAVIKQN